MSVAKIAPEPPPPDRRMVAMTVAAFCQANELSRPWFYRLMKRGEAPRSFLLGRKRYVTFEDAVEWARRMSQAGISTAPVPRSNNSEPRA